MKMKNQNHHELLLTKMTKIKKKEDLTNQDTTNQKSLENVGIGKDMEKLEPSYIVLGCVKWYGRLFSVITQKVKCGIYYRTQKLHPRYISKRIENSDSNRYLYARCLL